MKEINLVHLLSMLIKDYEKVYGITKFIIKKIRNNFIFTDINENLLDILNISRNYVVGKTLDDFSVREDSKKKALAMYEKAWNGDKMVVFDFFPDLEKILVYSLKPILKNGKTDHLEGHCAVLGFKDHEEYFNTNHSSVR